MPNAECPNGEYAGTHRAELLKKLRGEATRSAGSPSNEGGGGRR